MRATSLSTLPELPASLRQLKASQPVARCTRFALLQRFNALLLHIAPLVHTGPAGQGGDTLGGRLCRLRGLVFLEVKQGLLQRYAAATVTDADLVAVQLNRLRAMSKPAADGAHTVFAQLHAQLRRVRPRVLCRHDKACRVNFVGEASDDHGGPYREAICHLCTELQSEQLPLLIRCPNAQHAVGNGREAFLPNPSATGPQVRRQLSFYSSVDCSPQPAQAPGRPSPFYHLLLLSSVAPAALARSSGPPLYPPPCADAPARCHLWPLCSRLPVTPPSGHPPPPSPAALQRVSIWTVPFSPLCCADAPPLVLSPTAPGAVPVHWDAAGAGAAPEGDAALAQPAGRRVEAARQRGEPLSPPLAASLLLPHARPPPRHATMALPPQAGFPPLSHPPAHSPPKPKPHSPQPHSRRLPPPRHNAPPRRPRRPLATR